VLQSLLDQNLLLPCLAIGAIVLILVGLRAGWSAQSWFAKRREATLRVELRDAKAHAPNLASTLRMRDQTISALQDDNRDLRAGFGNIQREKNELERKLQTANGRLAHLSEEVATLRGGNSFLEDTVLDADGADPSGSPSQGDSAQKTEDQLRLARAQTAYLKLQTALTEKTSRIAELERDLESAHISTSGLTKVQYDALGEALKRAEATIAEQAQTLAALEEQKTTLEALAERRSRTNHTVREAEREAQARVRKLETELEQTCKTLSAREASIHRLFQELRDNQDTLRDTRERVSDLQNELAAREQALSDLQSLLSNLQRQVEEGAAAKSQTMTWQQTTKSGMPQHHPGSG